MILTYHLDIDSTDIDGLTAGAEEAASISAALAHLAVVRKRSEEADLIRNGAQHVATTSPPVEAAPSTHADHTAGWRGHAIPT